MSARKQLTVHAETYTQTRARQAATTYRMLLSLLMRKRPRMLMASTRRPLSLSTLMIVCTVSYRMAFPAFLFASVFVAT